MQKTDCLDLIFLLDVYCFKQIKFEFEIADRAFEENEMNLILNENLFNYSNREEIGLNTDSKIIVKYLSVNNPNENQQKMCTIKEMLNNYCDLLK